MKKPHQFLKIMYLLQILAVLCSTVMSSLSTVKADTKVGTDYGKQFITNAELEDQNGKKQDHFSVYDTMQAAWDFTIPAGKAKAGDKMTVSVPSAFTLATDTSFDIKDPAGVVIGHAVANAQTHLLTVTLTDAVQNDHNAITGRFKLWVKWDESKIEKDNTVDVDFGVGASTHVTVDPGGDPDPNELLSKWGWYDTTDPTLIHWQVRVNYAAKEIDHAKYEDDIGANQELVSGSEKAQPVVYHADGSVSNDGPAYPQSAIVEDGTNRFVIDLGDITKTIIINYDTRITDNGASTEYKNTGVLTGDQIDKQTVDVYSPKNGGGGNADTTIDIKGQKTWEDDNNEDGLRPDKITVHLLADGETVQSKTVTAQDGWAYDFTDLKEYDDTGKPITYTITEDAVPGYTSKTDGYNLINTHESETTQVSGHKKWEDNNNQDGLRPDQITVNLLANGQKVASKVVTAQDDWAYSFTGLKKYDDKGKLITYTVSENTVPGYASKTDGYDLINTHEHEVVQISGHKKWEDNDNEDGLRPDKITVNLLANGKIVNSQVVTAKNDWAYNFSNLPKYDSDGKLIVYAISENAVPGYASKTDGYDLINTHEPETTQVSGHKKWEDNNNQDGLRPDQIKVNLLANGKIIKSQIVTAASNWTYSFANLPKYESGKLITYTITEDAVPGYSSKTDGYDLINIHEPETTQVSGHKEWIDHNNQAGHRPNKIKVNLLANGKIIKSQIVTAASNWTYTFANLPKYESGKLITYTITEDAVQGYTSKTDGYNLINTLDPTPVNPTPVTPPVNPSPKKPEKHHDRLPQTGESQNETLLVIGGMLVLMGLIMLGVWLNKEFKKDK